MLGGYDLTGRFLFCAKLQPELRCLLRSVRDILIKPSAFPGSSPLSFFRGQAMAFTVEAVYENGVLKPDKPLPLQDHDRVQVTVHVKQSVARESAGMLAGAAIGRRSAGSRRTTSSASWSPRELRRSDLARRRFC
jgi:predicted DNA-binding antitoxin AbrB/MazE fold protein